MAFGTSLRVTGDYRKAGTSSLKRVTKRFFTIRKWFVEVSLDFLTKRQQKPVKTIMLIQKVLFWFLGPTEKYSSRDTIRLNKENELLYREKLEHVCTFCTKSYECKIHILYFSFEINCQSQAYFHLSKGEKICWTYIFPGILLSPASIFYIFNFLKSRLSLIACPFSIYSDIPLFLRYKVQPWKKVLSPRPVFICPSLPAHSHPSISLRTGLTGHRTSGVLALSLYYY